MSLNKDLERLDVSGEGASRNDDDFEYVDIRADGTPVVSVSRSGNELDISVYDAETDPDESDIASWEFELGQYETPDGLQQIGWKVIRPDPDMTGHGTIVRYKEETAHIRGKCRFKPVYEHAEPGDN